MASGKTIKHVKIIASTFVTAIFSAILYVCFLTMPLPFLEAGVGGINQAIALGMLAFFILGILVHLWTHKLHLLCIGVAIGIIGSGGWIEQKYSGHPSFGIIDKSLGLIGESIYHLTSSWNLVLPLFVSAAISWIITDFIFKKTQTIKSRKDNK